MARPPSMPGPHGTAPSAAPHHIPELQKVREDGECGPAGRHTVPPEPFGYAALEPGGSKSCCLKEEYDSLADFYVMCMTIHLLRVRLPLFGSSGAKTYYHTRMCNAPLTLPNCEFNIILPVHKFTQRVAGLCRYQILAQTNRPFRAWPPQEVMGTSFFHVLRAPKYFHVGPKSMLDGKA